MPVRKRRTRQKPLPFARFHHAVTGQNFQPGQNRLLAAWAVRTLLQPGQEDTVFARVLREANAAPVRRFSQGLAQEKTGFRVLASDSPTAETARNRREIYLGRISAQAEAKSALSLRR